MSVPQQRLLDRGGSPTASGIPPTTSAAPISPPPSRSCRRPGETSDVAIPITLAATGERAMMLAARVAQVWETSFCTPAEYARRRALFDEIIERESPARVVARSLEIDGFLAPTANGVDRVLAAVRADRGGAEDLEPILDRALVGTPDEVADQLHALAAVGVERVLVALHDPMDLDAIAALAEAAERVRSVEQSADATDESLSDKRGTNP
ncbi:MAG: hypothetical protein R2710_08345 [Acidimicrobiales bacterium]